MWSYVLSLSLVIAGCKTAPQSTCNQELVNCFVDPCTYAQCPSEPSAHCISDYCGGCHAYFYLDGKRLTEFQCHNAGDIFIPPVV